MDEPDFKNLRVAIVGLGLMGGSMAMALRDHVEEIVGFRLQSCQVKRMGWGLQPFHPLYFLDESFFLVFNFCKNFLDFFFVREFTVGMLGFDLLLLMYRVQQQFPERCRHEFLDLFFPIGQDL